MRSKFLNIIQYITIFSLLLVLFHYSSQIFHAKIHPTQVHKTLYIDRAFNNEETELIMSAANKWSYATKRLVTFDIVQLPQYNFNSKDALVFMKVTDDNPEALFLDSINNHNTLAFFNDLGNVPYIAVISDRIDDVDYEQVIMHELGHSIGLQHLTGIDGVGTLMYPVSDLGASEITYKDLVQFCELYHCDPKSLHYE